MLGYDVADRSVPDESSLAALRTSTPIQRNDVSHRAGQCFQVLADLCRELALVAPEESLEKPGLRGDASE